MRFNWNECAGPLAYKRNRWVCLPPQSLCLRSISQRWAGQTPPRGVLCGGKRPTWYILLSIAHFISLEHYTFVGSACYRQKTTDSGRSSIQAVPSSPPLPVAIKCVFDRSSPFHGLFKSPLRPFLGRGGPQEVSYVNNLLIRIQLRVCVGEFHVEFIQTAPLAPQPVRWSLRRDGGQGGAAAQEGGTGQLGQFA